MSLANESGNGMVMPVSPMYGYGGGSGFDGFGGDGGWWLLLLLFALGGNWGGFGGFGGGTGAMANFYDFPWLMNGQQGINTNTNNGFQNALLNDNITSVRDGISDISTQLCNGFAGVNAGVANGFSQAEIAANGRQMANMNQAFAAQTAMSQGFNGVQSQLADCCCENRLASADLKYTIATENCADRYEAANNTRDIIESQTRGTQAILDKLCALELDGVKSQLAQAERENLGLQNQLNMASFRESQTAQNALITQGFSNEVDALYNRLNACPVPTTPVYGRTPIFTCNNNGCGCGCGNNF